MPIILLNNDLVVDTLEEYHTNNKVEAIKFLRARFAPIAYLGLFHAKQLVDNILADAQIERVSSERELDWHDDEFTSFTVK